MAFLTESNEVRNAPAPPLGGAGAQMPMFNLTFSSQNVNSLNLTGPSKNLDAKVAAITSTKSDIIFLSDVRLVNPQGVNNDFRVATAFKDSKNRSYSMYHNSKKNSRGVVILVGNTLDIEILGTDADLNENYLLIRAAMGTNQLIIGAVYGPNSTDRAFFHNLERGIERISGGSQLPVILGGDWNVTWDLREVNMNIDTFQMAATPNRVNAECLNRMCGNLSLTDPYRILYPEKRDFTYQPFGTVRLNRSRIDFFCISTGLLEYLVDSGISSSPIMSGFDHKNIHLKIGKQSFIKQERSLSNQFLGESIVKFTILASAIRSHIQSINQHSVLNRAIKRNIHDFLRLELQKIERVRALIKQYLEESLTCVKNPSPALENNLRAKLRSIEGDLDDCVSLAELETFEKNTDPNVFFEKLTVETKRAGIWVQHFLFKITKEQINTKEKNLAELKKNFNVNFDQIFRLEREISKIRDDTLTEKLTFRRKKSS